MMPFSPMTKDAVDFRRLLNEGAILVDIRTPEEFRGYHLENAVNIPVDDIDRFASAIRAWNRVVIVYGADDQRSRQATTKLRRHGVEAYDGGERDCLSEVL